MGTAATAANRLTRVAFSVRWLWIGEIRFFFNRRALQKLAARVVGFLGEQAADMLDIEILRRATGRSMAAPAKLFA